MAIVTTDDKHYKAIADTIRNFGDSTAQPKPEQMADAVSNSCITMYNSGLSDGWQGGYEAGYKDGYDAGYANGQAECDSVYYTGLADGKKAEYDRFWDAYQQNGNKTDYDQAFIQNHWTDETFIPKYPLRMEGNVGGRQTFSSNRVLTRIPVAIYAKNTRLVYTFQNCSELKTILLLHIDGVTDFNSCFLHCVALENITIGGSIEKSIALAQSNLLTNESVQSIIDHLKDLTGLTAETLTFHADVGAKLTEAQKATITAKNWTLVY